MNDQEYLSVMSELKFIGSVRENQYINIGTGTITNKNLYNSTIRSLWYKAEGGKSASTYCRTVISKALALLEKYNVIENAHQYTESIKKYITEAKVGIEHLKTTHKNNNMAYALFDTIIVTIDQRLEQYQEK